MASSLALVAFLIFVIGLLNWDPARRSTTSATLWIPVIWLFIMGSRLPSQWLGGDVSLEAAALQEGNPLDRTVSSVLILSAVLIVISRRLNWSGLLQRNFALVVFLAYALVSVLWSDFPLVALKRWIRDLGNYFIVLIPLTDAYPLEAVRTILRRVCFLLIPLSVLLIKYFPEIAKQYEQWTGVAMYTGAATSKNMLGVVCLVSGLFFLWDTAIRWRDRNTSRGRRTILVNLGLISMTLWLMNLASSTTSRLCLLLGWLVIALAHTKVCRRHPKVLLILVPSVFGLYLLLAFGFGMNGEFAGAVGKDPTLTDRTKIWAAVLSMHVNPILGTGYESFWMGSRLAWFWDRSGLGSINEAHNGYLEVYLNLGIIGLGLLIAFLAASYRNSCRRIMDCSSFGSLSLAMSVIILFYCVTEAGFRSGLMWVTFLLGAVTVPKLAQRDALQTQPQRFARIRMTERHFRTS